jgi:hypothetical protein
MRGEDLGLVDERANSRTCSGASLGFEKEPLCRAMGELEGEPGLCWRLAEGLVEREFALAGPKVVKAKLSLPDSLPVEPIEEVLPCLL